MCSFSGERVFFTPPPLPQYSGNQYAMGNRVKTIPILSIVFTLIWPYPYRQLWPFFSFCHNGHHRYGHIMAIIMVNIGIVLRSTSENSFKNALIYQKLWPKQIMDKNYGHFLCILSPFRVENMVSRGSTSHASSELIFMFLESGGQGEWGRFRANLQSDFLIF